MGLITFETLILGIDTKGFGRKNIPLRKKNRGIWNADIHSGVALVCPHTTRNMPNPLAISMFLSRCFDIHL